MTSRQPFYTDMGAGLELRDAEGAATSLPRYGAWKWDYGRGKHQVAEIGSDLEALRAKHGDGPLVDLKSQGHAK